MSTLEEDHTGLWRRFGDRLRYWRKRSGLSQAQLGTRLGYHHTQVSKLESGFRVPQRTLAACADGVLDTGGELSAIWEALMCGWHGCPEGPSPARAAGYLPLPGQAGGPVLMTLALATWPARLPARCVPCPLHHYGGCVVPAPAEAIGIVVDAFSRMKSATPPSPEDPDLMHAFAAVLAAYLAASAEHATTDMVKPVEYLLHAMVGWSTALPGPVPPGLLRLCAHYAQLAGWLRVLRGQPAAGMGWLHHGVRWAGAGNDYYITAVLLSNMSMLSHMEGDHQSAARYAQAITTAAPGRRWAAIVGSLYEARALAAAGNVGHCEERIGQARVLLSRLDERDRIEAVWLDGAEGQMRVENSLSGSLRDAAALSGAPELGLRAAAATQQALATLPARLHSTRLVLTLRLADSYACAGQPEAAVATVRPVLLEAAASGRTTISGELRGLRGRLLSGWGDLPEVKVFDEQSRCS